MPSSLSALRQSLTQLPRLELTLWPKQVWNLQSLCLRLMPTDLGHSFSLRNLFFFLESIIWGTKDGLAAKPNGLSLFSGPTQQMDKNKYNFKNVSACQTLPTLLRQPSVLFLALWCILRMASSSEWKQQESVSQLTAWTYANITQQHFCMIQNQCILNNIMEPK